MHYLALLRGINVGGNKKIKMAELKQLLETNGLGRVQTYIQSGNVLFESEEDPLALQTKIETEIKNAFGFSVAVILRTADELKRVIADCPYSPDSLAEGDSIHVTFLGEEPSEKDLEKLSAGANEFDEYQILGREIHIWYRQRILDSKLTNQLQKLKVPASSRNWNTVTKLAEMMQAMEV
nr:DUF1697 domain-containing protein [Tumebacillus amylolyticus]